MHDSCCAQTGANRVFINFYFHSNVNQSFEHDTQHMNVASPKKTTIVALMSSTKTLVIAWNIEQWFCKFSRTIMLSSWLWRVICVWEHFNEMSIVYKILCYIHWLCCVFFTKYMLSLFVVVLWLSWSLFCYKNDGGDGFMWTSRCIGRHGQKSKHERLQTMKKGCGLKHNGYKQWKSSCIELGNDQWWW
jgi:hypothetical protein